MARKPLLTIVVATNEQRECCTGNVSCAGEQWRTTKARRKNTVKTGVSRETWYIFLSKKISERVVDDINNVDHRRCEGVVWL